MRRDVKPILWVGSCREDLRTFPEQFRRDIGQALYAAQQGETDPATKAPTGFGARRVINGKPRAPHSGADYAAPKGTAVVAANTGRVALVGDFFFPGRLVVLDHGHAVYTLYFHLDTVAVGEGEVVDRGHIVGTVGATGRATGPHLHFGALVGGARIDPVALMSLNLKE